MTSDEKEAQTIARLNAMTPNMQFVRWVGEFKTIRTASAVMRCSIHNHDHESTVNNFLYNKPVCPLCTNRQGSSNAKKDDEVLTTSFLASGVFSEGTKFTRNDETDEKGYKPYWNLHCPICAEDEYTKAGLCTGTFKILSAHIANGNIPCRCSKAPRLTNEQWKYRVAKEIERRDIGLSLVRAIGTGGSARLLLHCDEHGDFELTTSAFINSGSGCPSCAKTGFDKTKSSVVYVLRAEGRTGDFTGFGISNCIDKRMATHQNSLAKHGYAITDKIMFNMPGDIAASIERAIIKTFPIHPQDVEGFKREATFADEYANVIQFVEDALLSATAD